LQWSQNRPHKKAKSIELGSHHENYPMHGRASLEQCEHKSARRCGAVDERRRTAFQHQVSRRRRMFRMVMRRQCLQRFVLIPMEPGNCQSQASGRRAIQSHWTVRRAIHTQQPNRARENCRIHLSSYRANEISDFPTMAHLRSTFFQARFRLVGSAKR